MHRRDGGAVRRGGELVAKDVEAVSAVGQEPLEPDAAERSRHATGGLAERGLVADPPRRIPGARLGGAQDRELHAGRLEELCGGPRDAPPVGVEGPGAADPVEDVGRLAGPELAHPEVRGPRAPIGGHAAERVAALHGRLERPGRRRRRRRPASTSVRLRSTSLSRTSISKGHARTHAAHVVQDHASSGLTRLSSGRPSRIAWSVAWTTRLGSSGLPAAVAGHTAVHRPQRTHVAASSSWAQVRR